VVKLRDQIYTENGINRTGKIYTNRNREKVSRKDDIT